MAYKHTPGPWIFCNNAQHGWKTNPYSVCVQKKGVHSVTVANIPARASIGPQEAQANAALISAAPELLDCLLTMPQSLGHSDQDWWDWIDKVNRVLTKATNGEWK